MTPTLSAYLCALPLPVRLALLDADPNGAGWYVGSYDVDVYDSPERYGKNELLHTIRGGSAWLPCNPLAIVEYAARLRLGTSPARFALSVEDGTALASLVSAHGGRASYVTATLAKEGPSFVFTAAIKLLEEVMRG